MNAKRGAMVLMTGVALSTPMGHAQTADGFYRLRVAGATESVDVAQGPVSFTIDIIGDADEGLGTHMLWGQFGLLATGAGLIESMVWTPAPWSQFNLDGGYAGDGLYNRVEFGQFARLPQDLVTGSELGSPIGSFQITLARQSSGFGDLLLGVVATDPITISTIDSVTGASYYSTPETLVLEGLSVHIVPAPASIAALLGMGLVGARRRRA